MESAQRWLQAAFWPDQVAALVWITDWGGPLGWLIVIQLVFYLGGVRQGLYVGLSGMASMLLNSWLKSLLIAPRPYFLDPTLQVHQATVGLGMPSGHAQGAAVVWLALAQLRAWRWSWLVPALLLVVAVGLSRIALGVHSFPQVLAGWAVGLASLWLATRLRPWIAQRLQDRGRLWWCLGVGLALSSAALMSYGVYALQADFAVPALWQRNFAARSASADVLTAQALLAPTAAYALTAALAGLALVGLAQQWRPVLLTGIGSRACCLLVGCFVTAALWWFAQVSGWVESPLALLLPLLYPLVCGYLPVAAVARFGGAGTR